MGVIKYIWKGIVPVLWFLILVLFARYLCVVDGKIEWIRVMLLFGIPYGFPYLILYVPRGSSISGGMGVIALEFIVAALFGFVIAFFVFIKAIIYLVATPIQYIRQKTKGI